VWPFRRALPVNYKPEIAGQREEEHRAVEPCLKGVINTSCGSAEGKYRATEHAMSPLRPTPPPPWHGVTIECKRSTRSRRDKTGDRAPASKPWTSHCLLIKTVQVRQSHFNTRAHTVLQVGRRKRAEPRTQKKSRACATYLGGR
jgi:hypothetical protein